jgi:nicotinamidase-related amidase
MKPALLVQDIQNVWLYDPDSNQDLRKSVEKRLDVVNEAISWFRRNKFPIIVGYTEDKEQGLLPGTKSFEVPETVNIQETDLKVTKLHASAFGNPELGAMLRNEGCDTLVIVGLSASGCVLATYFSALDWDIRPYLIQGGVASHNEEHVRFAEEICDTLTLQALDSTFR